MARYLSLYLPFWGTDRLRRAVGLDALPFERPLVLQGKVGSRRLVTAVDALAHQRGVRPGMAVAKAQVLIDGLEVRDAEVERDAEALEKLAVWALRLYSPVVAADPPDSLILDITGAAHLYGGEAALVSDILRRLDALHITAYATVADSWGAAHALVRFAGKSSLIIPPGKSAEAILPLPVAALRLPAETVEELRLIGIDTIGELAAKPRAPLALRYGPDLWRRVDMAFGRLAEPIEPVHVPELISVERAFFEPIGAPDTLEKYTRRLTESLCLKLEEAGLGARRLDLHFVRVDSRIETISVGTAKPVRDVKRLSKLLVDKIETVEPGFGIDKMTLSAPLVEPLSFTQVATGFATPGRPDVDDLWDTLSNRYGEGRLYRAVEVASDIPERSVRRIAPSAQGTGSPRNARYRRPARLYRPEPVQALAALPDHPPRAFTWRGQRYSVVCADGPERVKGEWWVSEAETGKVRDYYILEAATGERFWVFRAGDGEHTGTGSLNWYLHGKFD